MWCIKSDLSASAYEDGENEMREAPNTNAIVLAIFFSTLLCCGGGFSNTAWCATGIIAAICAFARKTRVVWRNVIPYTLFLLLYAFATMINGAYTEGWYSCARMLTLLLVALAAASFSDKELTSALYYSASFSAVFSLIIFCGIIPWPGAMLSGRLFGLFQYANASGIYWAVCCLLFVKRQARTLPLMELSMLLTQSVGAIALYAVVLFWLLLQKDNREILMRRALSLPLSAAGAIGMILLQRAGLGAVGLLVVAFVFYCGKHLMRVPISKRIASHGTLVFASLLPIGGVLLLLLRGFRPLMTFAERLIQLSDAFALLAKYPLGIGPGAWQFHVLEYQSAGYAAATMHSFLGQLAVDTGMPGLALLLIALVLFLKTVHWKNEQDLAMLMLLMHGALDITFSFAALAVLLPLLQNSVTEAPAQKTVVSITVCRIAGGVGLAFCVCLLLQSISFTCSQRGQTFPQLYQRDTAYQMQQLRICYEKQDWQGLILEYQKMDHPSARADYHAAIAKMSLGDVEEAAELTLRCIEKSPYFIDGYLLLEKMIPLLPQERADGVLLQAEQLKADAEQRAHPFSSYLTITHDGGEPTNPDS